MANLREVVHHVQEEADFNKHLENFVKNATRSSLGAEPQPTTTDVAKIMKEFDSVSLDESTQR